MPTKREDDATYSNARKSTPRTPQPIASPNALKSGIHPTAEVLPCENRAAHDALIERYYHQHRPVNPEECCYVDEIVYCEWTLRRLRRADTELFLFVHEECFEVNENYPVGQPCESNPRVFASLQWRMDSTRRALKRAVDALRQLRVNPIPDPLPATGTIHTPLPEIGFLPSIAEPARSPLFEVPKAAHPGSSTETCQPVLRRIGFVTPPPSPRCEHDSDTIAA